MRFEGKKILVTGGTRGIGKSIADLFVAEGGDVIVTGRGDRTTNIYKDRKYLFADFSDRDSVDELLPVLRDSGFDICVNNAGINIIKPFGQVDADDFDKVMQVNLHTPFKISQAVFGKMMAKNWGRIVNIASIWSVVTKAGRSSYTSAKAGLVGMTRTMGVELARHNILVNSVSPGFTMTDLTRESLTPDEMAKIVSGVPAGRFAEPEEIARLVAFLCSAENTYIVGQNIVMDGGFTNV